MKIILIQVLIFNVFPRKFGFPITIFISFMMSLGNINLAATDSEISLNRLIIEELRILMA